MIYDHFTFTGSTAFLPSSFIRRGLTGEENNALSPLSQRLSYSPALVCRNEARLSFHLVFRRHNCRTIRNNRDIELINNFQDF